MGCHYKLKLVIKIIISLGCLLLCGYQVYIVGLLYYSYPTTVDLRIEMSDHIHLPGITICSDIAATILIDKIVELEPNLYHTFSGKSREELAQLMRKKSYRDLLEEPLQKLPINLQHQYTISAQNFFGVCELATPVGYQKIINYQTATGSYLSRNRKINCSQISAIMSTISYEKKCFTLFYNNEENYLSKNYQIPREAASRLKYLAWIRINRDYIYNGLIYVHSPKELHQNSEGNNIMQINANKDQFVSLSFSRTSTQLLPPPYATKCRNFTLDGYTSREHCIQQCKVDEYLKADGWPGDVFANTSVKSVFSKLWINSKSPSGHLEGGLAFDDKCNEKCGYSENCLNILYDMKTIRIVERDDDDIEESDWFTIGVLPPKTMDITCIHMPKLALIELVIYVGGLLNFYLGLSVVSIFVALFAILTLYYGNPVKLLKNKNGKNGNQTKSNDNNNRSQQSINNENGNRNYNYSNVPQSAVNPNQYYNEAHVLQPRPRLPGILQFMFDS